MAIHPPKRSALLIIDMQEGLFNGPERPYDRERVLANINRLIEMARGAGAPIFAARHTGPKGSAIEPGSALTQLISGLDIDRTVDHVFDKTRPSCFIGTGLAERLGQAAIGELVIAGMKTEYCVDTTCRAAADSGFRVILVADAHTTVDTPTLSARMIIDHHHRTLSGPFVTLLDTDNCVFQ